MDEGDPSLVSRGLALCPGPGWCMNPLLVGSGASRGFVTWVRTAGNRAGAINYTLLRRKTEVMLYFRKKNS